MTVASGIRSRFSEQRGAIRESRALGSIHPLCVFFLLGAIQQHPRTTGLAQRPGGFVCSSTIGTASRHPDSPSLKDELLRICPLEPTRMKCSEVNAWRAVENAFGDQFPGDGSERKAHHRVPGRNEQARIT